MKLSLAIKPFIQISSKNSMQMVTPTSQIVSSQAVMMGERYKSISKEAQALLNGEYGAAPASFNAELQKTCVRRRRADYLSAGG